MKWPKLFVIAVLFYGCLLASAMSHAQQILFKNFGVQDGLVANTVRTIFQDSAGFIWIGTWEGLSKYDGYRFTNFTTANGLSHNIVNDLFEKNNQLLIAENDGTIDALQNDRIQKIVKLPSPASSFLATKKGAILIATDYAGVYEMRKKKFYKPSQQLAGPIAQLLQINDTLFFAHAGEVHLQAFSSYKTIDTASMSYAFFGKLAMDSRKRIWLCTSQGLKLLSYSPEKNGALEFLPLPAPFNIPLLANSVVSDIMENADGSFWVATYNGLVYLENSGKHQLYTETNGLPSKLITTLYRDKEENLWIGTSLGLAKYPGKTNILNVKTQVSNMLQLPNGDWLLGTSDGLQWQQKKTNKQTMVFRTNYTPYTSHGYVTIIQKSNPVKFYHGNMIGVLNKEGTSLAFIKKFPLLTPSDVASCTDSLGNSFIANDPGIAVLTKRAWFVSRALPHRITSLAIDKQGYLWAGSWYSGLFRIKYRPSGDTLSFAVENFTNLVKTLQIRSLFCDSKGTVWVGTRYNGVFCLSPQTNGEYKVENFQKTQGLPSDFIISFAETPAGDIWAGTHQGLGKIVREKNGYRVFNFSKATNFFGQITALAPVDNNHWFCVASSNLFRFNDTRLEHEQPSQIRLLSVIAEDTTINPRNNHTKTALSYKKNNIKFIFGALSFANEQQVQYSYRLKGANDSSWSQPQNMHEVSYASLSPGEYLFEVRTIGWNRLPGNPACFSFTILSPYWKTWWFYIVTAILILLAIYLLYKYRITQLLRLQKVRNAIATNLHDDIGSTLTNISILTELSKKNISEPATAEKFLHRISEETMQTQQALDEIIWNVNTRHDSLQDSFARMRRYTAELFENSDIQCHIHIDEIEENKKLDIEQRRDIYLIYKECLNNIYKHANAKNIYIEVRRQGQCIYMHIRDDGKGFTTSMVTERNGIRNLTERAKKWKGQIIFDSEPDKGTSIKATIPMAS
jgi:ligand-binding sensor domain-containing protein/two-component sensor histidine kinase